MSGALRNLRAAGLRGRPRAEDPMARYDRLPAPLRRWLAEAALPWSPRSAARAWRRAWAEAGGDAAAALARLDALEARRLARDAPRTWGAAHPGAEGVEGTGAEGAGAEGA